MIRDPSDGSVREKPVMGILTTEKPILETSTSGLPVTANAKYLARLERSREWLKDYFKQPEEWK